MITLLCDYNFQWSVLLAGCMLWFCVGWVLPRFGAAAAALLAWCGASSIWIWAWPYNRYFEVIFYDQQALKFFACDSLAKIMIVCVPMMLFADRRASLRLYGTLAWGGFALASTGVALYQAARYGCNGLNCGGLVGNASISMGALVCMLPVFIRSWRSQRLLLLPIVAAVILSKSSIAAGLLAVYVGLWLFPWRLDFRRMLVPVATAAGALGAARLAAGGELLNDSDRFAVWGYMWQRWSLPWNIPTGTGLGTYHVLSSHLQHMGQGFRGNVWWLTLHNDWYQMLFECGAVGFSLLCFAYLSALIKTVKEQEYGIALSVVLYGLYMFLDPALHNPVPVLFGAWLFVYALRNENNLEVST